MTNRSASSQVGQTSSAPFPTTTTLESGHNNSNISQIATISTLNRNDSNSNVTSLVTSIPRENQQQQQQQQQASKPTTGTTSATNQANDIDNSSSTSRINETVTASDPRKNSESESLPVVNNNNKQSVESNMLTKEVQANNNNKSNQMVSFTELNSSTSSTTAMGGSVTTSQTGKDKLNYKRKYSEKINRAASSIVNFGAELSSSKPTAFFSDSFKENLENMSKVIQLCVSDMIKYSMDLFTVS